MTRSTSPTSFPTEEEKGCIVAAVTEAERATSAEIKVVLARHCWGDLKAKARKVFANLGLDKTRQRNAVLMLFVVANREFLLYGDEGIRAADATEADVRRAFLDNAGRGEFIILSRADQVYLQGANEEDGPFHLEFRGAVCVVG